MGVYIRMILYFASAWLSGQGLAIHDPDAGTLTFDLESVSAALVGLIGFVGTFVASRFAKARGGST